MRHILSILIENESGALSRVAGLFSARGYNIESLTVAATDDASLSRMTIVTNGTSDIIEQIVKQLNKLVEVVKLIDLCESDHIERELMLVKVSVGINELSDVKQLVDIFGGKILDVNDSSYVVELTGSSRKMDSFISSLKGKEIIEVVRTGVSGIGRGAKSLLI